MIFTVIIQIIQPTKTYCMWILIVVNELLLLHALDKYVHPYVLGQSVGTNTHSSAT